MKLWTVFLLILLTGCHAREPLTIGYIGPLSGQYSQVGIDNLRSAAMAAEELGNVRIVAEDGKFNAREAITAYIKLRDVDRIDALIVMDTPSIEALKPHIETDRMPTITIGQDASPRPDYVFHIAESAFEAYAALGAAMREQESPVFLVQLTTWGYEIAGHYRRGFGEGAQVIFFNAGDNPQTLIAVLDTTYDSISIDGTPDGWIPLYKAMIESGTNLTHVLNYNEEGNFRAGSIVGIPGEFFEGKQVVTIRTYDDPAFRGRFAARYGEPYVFFGSYGYDAVKLLAATNPREPGWGERMRSYRFSGVTGNITWNDAGDRMPEIAVGYIRNGSIASE